MNKLMKSSLVIYALLNLFLIAVFGVCPGHWDERGDSCIKVFNIGKSWGKAQTECQGLHQSHLIYLNGRTLRFLKDLTGFQESNEYSVGGKKDKNGVWKWGNGVTVDKVQNPSNGKYLLINPWNGIPLKFHPTDANHVAKYICEFSQASSTADSSSSINALSVFSSSQEISSSTLPSPSPSVTLETATSSPGTSSSSQQISPSPVQSETATPTSESLSSFQSPSISGSSSSESSSLSQHPSVFASSSPSSLSSSSSLITYPSSSINSKSDESKYISGVAKFIYDVHNNNVTDPASLQESVNQMQNLLTTHPKGLLRASRELETFALRYADYHLNHTETLIKTPNIVLVAANVHSEKDFELSLPDKNETVNKIVIPADILNQQGTNIVAIYYPKKLNNFSLNQVKTNKRYLAKSNILSAAIKPLVVPLVKNVTLGFQMDDDKIDVAKMCGFWDFAQQIPGWSNEGCSVAMATNQYIECSCNHLTHFAVLVQTGERKLSKLQDTTLNILTYIGLSASIIGCVLTFIAYWILTDIKSEQTQIRMNLVFFLAVAHLLFLLNSIARKNTIACIFVAVLMQFFYTSALCWMFAEGIQLYVQIVQVFNSELAMKKIYIFTLGFPTFLTICSLSIAGSDSHGLTSFVSYDFCWLSTKNHLIWVFIAPLILLILSNLVILAMVIKEMATMNQTSGDLSSGSSLRGQTKAFALLAPLLGVTWLTGLLCILQTSIVGLYVFTILNSTQGVFIFICHCVRNSEIRGKLQRRIKVIDESRPKPSLPSTNKSLKVQYKPKANLAPETVEPGGLGG